MNRHRVPLRRLTAGALVLPLVLTAGCTSSKPSHDTASSSTGSTGSTAPASPDAAAFASKLGTALDTLTSAKITIDAGGLLATTTGHITLSHGQATASDITLGSGADAVHVITVGAVGYAQLPKGQNTSGKPWVTVTSTSSNEFVRGYASTLSILQAASNLGDLAAIIATATGFTVKGSTTVNGVPATHYAFSVTGNADGSALAKELAALGSGPVPVDLDTDAQNRPVQIAFALSLGGSTVTVTVGVSDFNAAVTITAPPANEVASN